jgi:DNA mismatch repair protein MutL
MLKIEAEDTLTKVSGLISPPSLTRSNRSYFSLFVNHRWVHSPLLTRAIEEAYHGLLMVGKYPIAVINITLPAQEVDVNVHPTKAQAKFRYEQAIFASLEKAVKGALAKMPLATTKVVPFPATSWQQQSSWMIKDREPTFVAPLPASGLPVLRVMGQLANTYIIAEGPEGLYLIDQHAAHERVLYERILAQWAGAKIEVQGLLQPVTIELSPREEETLRDNKEILTQFGFAVEPFGSRSYLMRAVPVILTTTNLAEAITKLLDNLANKENPASWEEKIAESLACHSAIRAGQQLSDKEMRELISQLEQAHQPRTCPHGRPTMIHLSSYQLEKEFGRIG